MGFWRGDTSIEAMGRVIELKGGCHKTVKTTHVPFALIGWSEAV